MQDLGTPLGWPTSYPVVININDNGQVVGYMDGGGRHAFIWDAVNGMQDLWSVGGSWSEAVAINNSGQVLGSNSIGTFVWDDTNGAQYLDTLGFNSILAKDINDKGQVVGTLYRTWGEDPHAFLWDPVNGTQDLGGDEGDSKTDIDWEAEKINNAGVVMGQFSVYPQPQPMIGVNVEYHIFVWKEGVFLTP